MFSHIECTSHSTTSNSLWVTSESLKASPAAMPTIAIFGPKPKRWCTSSHDSWHTTCLRCSHAIQWACHGMFGWPVAPHCPNISVSHTPSLFTSTVCLVLLSLYRSTPHVPLRCWAPSSATTQPWGISAYGHPVNTPWMPNYFLYSFYHIKTMACQERRKRSSWQTKKTRRKGMTERTRMNEQLCF